MVKRLLKHSGNPLFLDISYTVRNTELNFGKIQWALLFWLLHFWSVLAFSCVVLSGVITWSSLKSDQPIWRIMSPYHIITCVFLLFVYLPMIVAPYSYGVLCLGPPLHSGFDVTFPDILSQDVYWYLEEWVDIVLELYVPQKVCWKSWTC